MVSMANHGDLLLFQTDNTLAVAQRFFTGSDFGRPRLTADHVAMLVKTEDNNLVVLEALGNCGVEINSWNTFLEKEWYRLYQRY